MNTDFDQYMDIFKDAVKIQLQITKKVSRK